jgi:hypothetical protein
VADAPELRPVLGAHLQAMRSLVGEIAATTVRASGVDLAVGPAELGTILVAVEDGLRLHRLIVPDSTPRTPSSPRSKRGSGSSSPPAAGGRPGPTGGAQRDDAPTRAATSSAQPHDSVTPAPPCP